jgi:hypothetical protein
VAVATAGELPNAVAFASPAAYDEAQIAVAIVVSQDRHVSVMWFNDEAVAVLRNAEWWL